MYRSLGSAFLPTWHIVKLLIFANLISMKYYLTMNLICFPQITNEVEHLVLCSSVIYAVLWSAGSHLLPIFDDIFCLFLINYRNSLYMSWLPCSFVSYMVCRCLLSVLGLSSHYLWCLWWTYDLIFSAVEFIIFHEAYAFVFLKKSFLTQDHNIILLLLSKSYTVFAFYVQVFNMPKMRFGCGKGICILFV